MPQVYVKNLGLHFSLPYNVLWKGPPPTPPSTARFPPGPPGEPPINNRSEFVFAVNVKTGERISRLPNPRSLAPGTRNQGETAWASGPDWRRSVSSGP